MNVFRVVSFVVVVASVGCASPSPSPTQNIEADKAKLQADATSWFDFYTKADGDGMANLYAEEAVLMPPGAPAASAPAAK
jgi:hypothetical protein